ncbi:hypothetical protein [Nocardia macrotermitis]|uniref:Lipoprotein LppI n=1 Tax=Nocardia macrotermitis TaxID=2585198 RepID=A0A7K0DD62_9NOCA|nr:hypothetical protein [Nocardia macrotermitis]MQY22824.1 hypothetical protein [Nocardia macrotermitis]
MRIAVSAALVLVVAGCSTATEQHAQTVPPSAAATSAAASSTTTASGGAPESGASFATVDAWVRSGRAADAAKFATATTEDGTTTPLKDGDVAFTSPTGKIKCTSDSEEGMPGMYCLVDLRNPPAQPAHSGEGEFVANWIDFTGTKASVGSMHGDPGPFVRGYGNHLPYGSRITTGDYTCRMDSTGLICADKTTDSAVRISDAGIQPFGCLREKTPTEGIGKLYGC